MSFPRWFKTECLVWLVTGLPLQFFFTSFNGLSFFTLPDLPGPDGSPSVAAWLASLVVLYHPVFMLPVAIWDSSRKAKNAQN